jgi:uncharacterized HAD superfamily protein
MSARKRFGVDIDGVCYQWSKTARYMLREVLPNSPYTSDGPLGQESTYWNYIPDNVAPEHWKWLWSEGVRLGLFRHGHMVPGTIEGMRRLAAAGDVIVITHRPKSAVADTLAWLAYQQLQLAGVHLFTNEEPKSGVACDVYIDDKPENCLDLAHNTDGAVFILDQPWNEAFYDPKVTRVADWSEFCGLVGA